MRTLLAVAAVVVAVPAGSATAAPSGLHGVVARDPTMPVCRAGTPCSAPAAHLRLTFVRAPLVQSTTTDAHGRYAIALPPGRYAVHVALFKTTVRPSAVVVAAGASRLQNLTVDTGIR